MLQGLDPLARQRIMRRHRQKREGVPDWIPTGKNKHTFSSNTKPFTTFEPSPSDTSVSPNNGEENNSKASATPTTLRDSNAHATATSTIPNASSTARLNGSSNAHADDGKPISNGAIAGIVVGGFFGLLFLCLIAYWLLRKCRPRSTKAVARAKNSTPAHQKQQPQPQSPPQHPPFVTHEYYGSQPVSYEPNALYNVECQYDEFGHPVYISDHQQAQREPRLAEQSQGYQGQQAAAAVAGIHSGNKNNMRVDGSQGKTMTTKKHSPRRRPVPDISTEMDNSNLEHDTSFPSSNDSSEFKDAPEDSMQETVPVRRQHHERHRPREHRERKQHQKHTRRAHYYEEAFEEDEISPSRRTRMRYAQAQAKRPDIDPALVAEL